MPTLAMAIISTAELIAVGTELLLGKHRQHPTLGQFLPGPVGPGHLYYHGGGRPQQLRAPGGHSHYTGLGPTDDLTKNIAGAVRFGKSAVFTRPPPAASRLRAAPRTHFYDRLEGHAARGVHGAELTTRAPPRRGFRQTGCGSSPTQRCRAMFTHRVIPLPESLADGGWYLSPGRSQALRHRGSPPEASSGRRWRP